MVAQSTEALTMPTCSDTVKAPVFSYSMAQELVNNTVGFPDSYLAKRSSVSLQLSTNVKVTTISLDLE